MILTPEEYARDLVKKSSLLKSEDGYVNLDHHRHIECAILIVKEIGDALIAYGMETDELQNMDRTFAYYDNVIEELRKMK